MWRPRRPRAQPEDPDYPNVITGEFIASRTPEQLLYLHRRDAEAWVDREVRLGIERLQAERRARQRTRLRRLFGWLRPAWTRRSS